MTRSGHNSDGIGKAVSNARLGEDERWFGGCVFEFRAQLAYEDAQILAVRNVGRAPDIVQQLAVGNHLARVAHQKGEKFEFLRRQTDRFPALSDVMARQINSDTCNLELSHWICIDLMAAAQRRPHPRQKFTNAERFVDEIVGAEVERRNLLAFAVAR